MTDRGLPIVDGAPACPFVALEDDRDARSPSPDHRHRCYAEVRPAQRALAHQEAYCLSSAFAVCPTFQDWARREAAAARPDLTRPERDRSEVTPPTPPTPPRAPRREWNAPPPWATGDPNASTAPRSTGPAGFWERPGADEPEPEGADEASDSLAALAATRPDAAPRGSYRDEAYRDDAGAHVEGADDEDEEDDEYDDDEDADAGDERGYRSGDRSDRGPRDDREARLAGEDAMERSARRRAERAARQHAERERAMVGRRSDAGEGGERQHDRTPRLERGPSWEQPRRFEAYPRIRSRIGLPGIPRVAVLAVAVVLAGAGLFMLPALLGIGGPDGGSGLSPSPSAAASPSDAAATAEPTPVPEPTQVVYVVQGGDTLSKIANRFGVTLADLLEANKDTIKDPNRINVGDRIIIPAAPPTEFVDPGAGATLPPP